MRLLTALLFLSPAALAQDVTLTLQGTVDLNSTSDATAAEYIGSNPSAVAWDGTDAFVAGFNNTGSAVNAGIVKVTDALGTGSLGAAFGQRSIPAFRGFSGLDLAGGTLASAFDAGASDPRGIEAFDAAGNLLWSKAARGGSGVGIDPGFGGVDSGVGWTTFGSGRRSLQDTVTGADIYTGSDGLVIFTAEGSFWRDMDFDDATGDLWLREGNNVIHGVRTGGNSASMSVPYNPADSDFTAIQNIAFCAVGTDSVVFYNDRASTSGGQVATDVLQAMDGAGNPVTIHLSGLTLADGNGAYDFAYDVASQTLALLDFASRDLHILSVSMGAPAAPGDACADAIPVVAGANAFDTTGLSDSGYHDGSCVSRDGFTDIWFVYTAGASGDHTFDTCGSDFDTVLRVLDSADCATAACIAGNDDACALSSGSNFASSVTANLTAGQSYLVHVEGWGASDAGAGTLTIAEPDTGDTCAEALPVVAGANAFDTTGLSDSGYHDGSCVSRDGFTDIWFVYTAAITGDHVLNTCGSDFDTVLRVLDSADCATAACIAGNDDACALSSGSNFASEVTVSLTSGQSYLVHVEGWGASDAGAGTLTITEPSADNGDDCSQALPVVDGANAFDTTALTDSGYHDGSCVSRDGFTDIWFVYTASVDGDHVLGTCGSDFDTVLRVLDSADCATAACIAGNDDACAISSGSSFASEVTATLTAGQSYLVHVEGWGASDVGAGTLTITPPSACDGNDDLFTTVFANGDCANASPLVSGVYTGLTVCKDRLDFYTFTVADGATLDAQIQFATATNDLDMFLYDAATCNSDPSDPGCTGSLACGYSASDNETISWTNTTGADAVVTLRVNIWANDAADIGTYDMSISGIAAGTVSVVCTPPNANSTGGAVTIGASNSGFFTSGGAPVTWLNATGGPDGEFGYFLVSATYAEPGVSVADGLLCLTGGIGRYNNEAGNNNALRNSTGTFVASATGGLSVFECANGLTIGGAATGFNVPDQLPWINGSSIPAPNIQPGDTWNFQMWYRDGASSNFSDAVSVQF